MKFYEDRMREMTDSKLKILEKIYSQDGSCMGVECIDCPFGNSIISYGYCGNAGGIIDFEHEPIADNKLEFRMKICKELIEKYKASILQSRLQKSENEITKLKSKIKELESEIETLKMTPLDIVVEEIKNHKFTKVTKQPYTLLYDSSYPSWMIKEHRKEFIVGLVEFTHDDAQFLCGLLNRSKIGKEQIKNINEILGGIKYE